MSNKNTSNAANKSTNTNEAVNVQAPEVVIEGTVAEVNANNQPTVEEQEVKSEQVKKIEAAAANLHAAQKRSFHKAGVVIPMVAASLGVTLGSVIHNLRAEEDQQIPAMMIAAMAGTAAVISGTTQSLIQLVSDEANDPNSAASSLTGFVSAQVGAIGSLFLVPSVMNLLDGEAAEVEEVVAIETTETAEVMTY